MIIIFIVVLPLQEYQNLNIHEKLLLAGFVTFSIITQFHSAMRLVIPGITYGFAFASLNFSDNPLETLEESES